MKTKLLFIALFLSIYSTQAQQPVASYFGNADYIFANIEPATPISHSTSGANVTWTFSGLSLNGTSSETNSAPTSTEITTFPNSDNVHIVSTLTPSPAQLAKIYSYTNPNNVYAFTGFDANGVILNYNTNIAALGQLPFNFGFSNNDTTSGTFAYGATTGTFSGTITTNYDSFGTLNLNIDTLPSISKNVFRVSLIQNINLFINVFINIGTVQQTTYTYYFNDNGDVRPYFRDTSYTVNVPLLNLVQTTNQGQLISDALINLKTDSFANNSFSISPNPVSNYLNINSSENLNLNSVEIFDTNSRKVKESSQKSIDVSGLENGIYFAKIQSVKGSSTIRFIKN